MNDNHNTKNIALPLIVSRRLELMEKGFFPEIEGFHCQNKEEPRFSPEKDVDVSSLRFGAPSAVDFGKGLTAKTTKKEGDDFFEKGMALHSPSSYTWMLDGRFDELRLSVGAAKASLGGSVFEI